MSEENRFRGAVRLVATPLGRFRLKGMLAQKASPILVRLASLYRRFVLRDVRVVAVVGSFGKTTTTRAIKTILGEEVLPWPRFSIAVAVARDVLAVRPSAPWAVFEAGIDGPGQMEVLARILQPDITVVTSIGSEHLTSMKSLDVTRTEKEKMVTALGPDGVAILNHDDERVRMMAEATAARVVRIGCSEDDDVQGRGSTLEWPAGECFDVCIEGKPHRVATGLVGAHWLHPILSAIAVGRELGISTELCVSRLRELRASAGRLEPVPLPGGAMLLLDDRKASYETMGVALDALERIPAKRRIALIGELTEPPGSIHVISREVGARVGQVASQAIFVGSRNLTRGYARGAGNVGLADEAITRVRHDIVDAMDALPDDLGPGDVILMKGSKRQHLARIAHMLQGADVRCRIPRCSVSLDCEHCPRLLGGNTLAEHGEQVRSLV